MKKGYLFIPILLFANLLAYAQTDIRKVDFMNFTYMPSCAGEEPQTVTVTNGEFSSEKKEGDYVDRFYFNILAVEYGDLTGDKQDEAVIRSVCNTGGTGQFSEGFIYTLKAGKAVMLSRVEGRDRADGGLRSLKVENGLLVIVANDGERSGGACCPEGTITQKARLSGSKLIDVGQPIRSELYPKERLAFAKGKSEKTFSVTIGPEDRKRYTVGARAGQTLTVELNSGDAALNLMGDIETQAGTNSFTAKLPTNGDYTFEVSNYGDKDIRVNVTVKIR